LEGAEIEGIGSRKMVSTDTEGKAFYRTLPIGRESKP
jgi:hypothetical protein